MWGKPTEGQGLLQQGAFSDHKSLSESRVIKKKKAFSFTERSQQS